MVRLFYSKKKNNYYYTDKYVLCRSCNKSIKNIVFVVENWGKKKSSCSYFCQECKDNIKSIKDITVFKIAMIIDLEDIPKDSVPIYVVPPSLKNGSFNDLFNIDKLQSDETIDHTKLSGRESLSSDMQIGNEKQVLIGDKRTIDLNHIKEELKPDNLIEYDQGLREAEQKAQDIRETIKLHKFTIAERDSLLYSDSVPI